MTDVTLFKIWNQKAVALPKRAAAKEFVVLTFPFPRSSNNAAFWRILLK